MDRRGCFQDRLLPRESREEKERKVSLGQRPLLKIMDRREREMLQVRPKERALSGLAKEDTGSTCQVGICSHFKVGVLGSSGHKIWAVNKRRKC